MSSSGPSPRPSETARHAGRSIYDRLLDIVLTGIAITVPFVVTIYILQIALEFVRKSLNPFIQLLQWLGVIQWFERVELVSILIELQVYSFIADFLTELIAVGVLLGVILLVGTIGHNHYGEHIIRSIDFVIASIPGIGTIYKSFRRMGDVMLSDEAENFQEIKLVQLLSKDVYVIGFETSRSPDAITEATGHEEMITMFIPLAPNPVTGGFLTYVPRSQVMDVDMTIEEGVRSILTSGVATGDDEANSMQLSLRDLEQVPDINQLQESIPFERRGVRRKADDSPDEESSDESSVKQD